MRKHKYYVFAYRDGAGGGRHYFLADDARSAWKSCKRFLKAHHPGRQYDIQLERVWYS